MNRDDTLVLVSALFAGVLAVILLEPWGLLAQALGFVLAAVFTARLLA